MEKLLQVTRQSKESESDRNKTCRGEEFHSEIFIIKLEGIQKCSRIQSLQI